MESGSFSQIEHKGVAVLYFLFGVVGVLTNSAIIKTFMKHGALTTPKNILHINLAFGNILVVAGFPFSGLSSLNGKWVFGATGCQLYGIESFVGGIGSLGFVIALCLERYLSNSQKQIYATMTTSTWMFISVLVWLHAVTWGVLPVLGWSRYSVEPSGVACGLDWLSHDYSHTTYVFVMVVEFTVLYLAAALFIKSAKRNVDDSKIPEVTHNHWFSEKQLVWMSLTFLMFAGIGWGPYGYFAIWSLNTSVSSITMLAATLPPLFAKGAASFYIVPYMVSSDKFRDAVLGADPLSNNQKKE